MEGPPKGRGKGSSLGTIRIMLGTQGRSETRHLIIFYSHEENPLWKCPMAARVRGEGGYVGRGKISWGIHRLSLHLLNVSYQRVQSRIL